MVVFWRVSLRKILLHPHAPDRLGYMAGFPELRDKAVLVLKTIGSSVLMGAITTFLGTLPLAFSMSDIFYTIFVAFFALVVLGATHGLILLPVVLSMIGPEVEITAGSTKAQLPHSISGRHAITTENENGVDVDGDDESVHA